MVSALFHSVSDNSCRQDSTHQPLQHERPSGRQRASGIRWNSLCTNFTLMYIWLNDPFGADGRILPAPDCRWTPIRPVLRGRRCVCAAWGVGQSTPQGAVWMSKPSEVSIAASSFSHSGTQTLPTRRIRVIGVPLDMDWIDPEDAPGVGTPVRGARRTRRRTWRWRSWRITGGCSALRSSR